MFTGIVEELGKVRDCRPDGDGYTLSIDCKTVLEGTALGDSIAVNGVCLTVTELDAEGFVTGLAPETRHRTALEVLDSGSPVNLERSVTPSTRMGGHFVQGHVDGTGSIGEFRRDEDALWVTIKAPASLMRYIVVKGYITLDGTSLTVVDVGDDWFSVTLVAYTQAHIVMPSKKVGDPINIEVDVLGKYVERLIQQGAIAENRGPQTLSGVTDSDRREIPTESQATGNGPGEIPTKSRVTGIGSGEIPTVSQSNASGRNDILTESQVTEIGRSQLPTEHGVFDIVVFRDKQGLEHSALTRGDLSQGTPLVRLHSECLTGDAFGSLRCDCGPQLQSALKLVAECDHGAIVYLRQEGRGIGLGNKIRAYALQDGGLDTVDANQQLGFPADARNYDVASNILKALRVTSITLLSNNPAKRKALTESGIDVTQRQPLVIDPQTHNRKYLETKAERMGHNYKSDV